MLSANANEVREALETDPADRTVRQKLIIQRMQGRGPILQFVDTPPKDSEELAPRVRVSHLTRSKILKRNPGRWALLMTCTNRKRARAVYANVRNNRYRDAYQPLADFHFRLRVKKDGTAELYGMFASSAGDGFDKGRKEEPND